MKKLLILLLIIGVLIAGVFFYLKLRKSKDFQPAIKQRLSKLVSDASGGLYKLEIENLEIDILDSKLTLVNAHLVPDTAIYTLLEQRQKAPNDLFDVRIDKLSIDDIDITSLATNKNIRLNKLFVDAPEVKVWHKKQPYNIPADSNKTIYQQISKDISSIKVDTILVRNVGFTHYNRLKKDKKSQLKNVNLVFTGLLMDSTTQYDKDRFLYAEDCRISVQDYTINTSDNLYRFSAAMLQIKTRDQVMEMDSISLKPVLNRADFYKKVGFQKDIFDIKIAKMGFNKVEWWSLLAEESFLSSVMSLEDGRIRIYNDKSKQPEGKSRLGKFPHQLLAKVPFNIELDTIRLSNIDVSYEEFNPVSNEAGTISFDNIRGKITNITNNPARIKQDKHSIIDVNAVFLKKTPLKAIFDFDLMSIKSGAFAVKASLGSISNEQLNTILIPLAMVKINSVQVKSVDIAVTGDNYRGNGTVKLLYEDLNITALKNKDDTLKKRSLLSFIANNFIIKKENPEKGEAPRVESGTHQHVAYRSFFNLLWKTIFVSAAKTVGYKAKNKK
ncbi:MAG: hypothetical protein H7Y03_11015 [Chitinophagaceae bacterium]|nr:hypothetical protein [Chitinophagaceae bacterium]